MPSPSHVAYRNFVLEWFRSHADKPDVAAQLQVHGEAALVLWELDLEAARPVLKRGYANHPRGGNPWDPLALLRCLLLTALLRKPQINSFVPDLKADRTLCVLCGIDPDGRHPGVGTLYDFLHRLHNGPLRDCPCGHQMSPATLERRRAATPRPRNTKPKRTETKAEKRERLRRRDNDPVTAKAAVSSSATKQLCESLRAANEQLNPEDQLERLAEILLEVSIVKSAKMGLLGSLEKLVACGDGSALPTGASRHGKRSCSCPKSARCECPRIYHDPDAAIGYDSYRERYFFGHHIYELCVSSQGHDLPLHLRLDPGNESDFTASLKALDRLRKLLRHSHPEMTIRYLVQDKGHDGEYNYRFPLEHDILPVIPLAKDAPVTHPMRPELNLSSRGVPLCKAGIEMAPWGSAGKSRRLFACPVKAGFVKRCPLAPEDDPSWLCRPDAAMAPVVNLSIEQNPRLCPPVPRNSALHQELYNLRSGCERSFSAKKTCFNLEAARHCRKSFWLTRLYLMAVLQHAKAWVANGDPTALVDHLLGRTREQPAA